MNPWRTRTRWLGPFVMACLPIAIVVAGLATCGCQSTKSPASGKNSSTAASTDSEGQISDKELERRVQAHAAFAAGVLHQERDEPEEAYAQFARAAEKDPSNEGLATEVAGHYLQRNELDAAIQVLQRTAAEPGTSGVTKTLLAVTYRRAGRTNEAIVAYRDAIQSTPTLLASYQELAELYLARHEPAKAAEVIRQSLGVTSDSAQHWINTADLFAWLGQAAPSEKAVAESGRRTALDRAQALKPTDPGLLLRMGRARMELGESAQAEVLIQEAGQLLPKDPAVAASKAELLIREGRFKEARESLELLSRVNPTSHFPWYFLGIVDLEEHRDVEAIRKFERSIALNPDFEPAFADLSVAQMNQKEFREALATLTRAGARFTNSFRIAFLTGIAQTRIPDMNAALASFEHAEKLAERSSPESLDARYYFQVGAALERGGRMEESVRYLEKSLELQPDFDEALNHLGYLWAEKGIELDRAHDMIRRAVAAEPENPAYLDSMGWVLFKQGKPAEALVWMEKAVRLLPEPDATVYDHLGDVLAALGRKSDARDAWQKSLSLEKSEAVQKKLNAP